MTARPDTRPEVLRSTPAGRTIVPGPSGAIFPSTALASSGHPRPVSRRRIPDVEITDAVAVWGDALRGIGRGPRAGVRLRRSGGRQHEYSRAAERLLPEPGTRDLVQLRALAVHASGEG